MPAGRRHQRYPLNLRLRLQLPAGELETTTDEISLAGFSAPCADLPEVGTRFGFAVHLPDGAVVFGVASAMRITPDGLAGFSCEFEPEQAAQWQAFLEQERASGGVWRMIARYALQGGEEKEAARSVLEKSSLGILFRRIGKKAEGAPEAPVAMRLHMVGENGEAYRVAFEKHPSDPPEGSAYAAADPRVLELARRAASRILQQDVFLKRSASAPVEPVRLVELKRGGFGYVVPHPTAKPSLMGLQGSELMVVEADGEAVFPFFDAADLERIAHDTFRRASDDEGPAVPAPAPALLREERFSAAYAHKEVDTDRREQSGQRAVLEAMKKSPRAQTRVYGNRAVKLFPEVWVELVRPGAWAGAVRGFAMEDGAAPCVFVLSGPDAPRVVKLEPTDLVALLRGGSEG